MKNGSVLIAKDRLKSLLVSDRVNCTPDTFEKMDSFSSLQKLLFLQSFSLGKSYLSTHLFSTQDLRVTPVSSPCLPCHQR